MGINICIIDENTEESISDSIWNSLRLAGDSDLVDLFNGNRIYPGRGHPLFDAGVYRPKDIFLFQKAVSSHQCPWNLNRGHKLVLLLMNNPNYWVSSSL